MDEFCGYNKRLKVLRSETQDYLFKPIQLKRETKIFLLNLSLTSVSEREREMWTVSSLQIFQNENSICINLFSFGDPMKWVNVVVQKIIIRQTRKMGLAKLRPFITILAWIVVAAPNGLVQGKRWFGSRLHSVFFFKKMGHSRPLFRLFSSFSNKNYIFYNK